MTSNRIDLLTFALSEQRTVMTDTTGSVTVELTADGSITAIRLSEAGHRMTPAMVAELIMSLHTAGLAKAQEAIEAALSDSEAPVIPTLDLVDTPAEPRPTEEAESATSIELPSPAYHFDLSPPSTPAQPAVPPERAVEQPQRHEPQRATTLAPTELTPTPHTEISTPAQTRPQANPELTYPDDASDEDEYFRTFSVFEYDDHRPHGHR